MTFPDGAIVGFAPVGTPLTPDLEGFEPIGRVANPAKIRPRLSDVLGEALRDAGLSMTARLWLPGDDDPALTIPAAREYSATFTVQKVNRRTLRLLFGDAVPRSARSMRRRRANLRRKRQMRKKHR